MSEEQLQRIGDPREKPTRVLVLGATGMVGRSWCAMLEQAGVAHRALSRPEFDLLEPESVVRAVEQGDQLVVNAAAWTDVDGAEDDPEGATQANGHSVALLAQRCQELGAFLIHYSTDYVFDGKADRPYPIDTPINPCNVYGRSKAIGEELLGNSGCQHLIIRTSWVYAPWGKNFVRTIARFAGERSELRVVDDQCGRPTSAEYLAETSLHLYQAGGEGVWHATDGGECTWHEFACAIAAEVNPRCTVHPCSSNEYPRPAFRPPYSVLDIEPTEGVCGPLSPWEENLRDTLGRIDQYS